MPFLRGLARQIGRDHPLALELWASGVHEARILAALVDDPRLVTEEQMESWVADLDSWDVCDQLCGNLFDKTPFAYGKAAEWSSRPETFVKRAGFVLMTQLAVHDKAATDESFRDFLDAGGPGGRRRAQLREEGGELGAPPDRQAKRRSPCACDRDGRDHRRDGIEGRPLGGRGCTARASQRCGAAPAWGGECIGPRLDQQEGRPDAGAAFLISPAALAPARSRLRYAGEPPSAGDSPRPRFSMATGRVPR